MVGLPVGALKDAVSLDSWVSEAPEKRYQSEMQMLEERYVSLNLVYSYWARLGGYREIGDARAYDDLLDDRARHPRFDHRRRRYPYVFAAGKRTISSRRLHFFHTGCNLDSLHLL